MSRYEPNPYFEKIKTEQRKMEILKKAIRESVRDEFGFKVTRIIITPDLDDDGDKILRVELWIKNDTRKLKKGDNFHLLGVVSKAIREAGGTGYPIIDSHVPDYQGMSA